MSEGHAKVTDNYANISDEFRRRHKVTKSFALALPTYLRLPTKCFVKCSYEIPLRDSRPKSRKYELTPSILNENMLDKFKRIKNTILSSQKVKLKISESKDLFLTSYKLYLSFFFQTKKDFSCIY